MDVASATETEMEMVLAGYAGLGAEWIARSDGLSCDEIYAPVADLLPLAPSRVLDLGAATGRDAAWLVSLGHCVTAVEPVRSLREAGLRLHPQGEIDWVDDRLPGLERIDVAESYGCVLANGVLHHLEPAAQQSAIRRLAPMLDPGGLMIASLRHGAGPEGRKAWPIDVEALVGIARTCGLDLIRRVDKGSIQPENQTAGITWTWLALRRSEGTAGG
ncbi:hypothetical protein HPDFL43_04870 [Hoeflea phototrophica DFL-43]|jgi:SAM-dependent methyltransferase|uniref:Methyltransferase domain-containing protein n=1 Tax=Hoeflea phototrophica (strain DSM 17068 / NCIMB 14078 / DFL-43) TaxID=411684 RepID=A9D3W2_HOEPD|nr:class I SAM-dependent methyltransferase [Hoeflea phototrophica]EDQ33757.1 hypothetical protein HPDFL43_04870 [Hoeflea phototrophica DFL-43]